MKTIEKGKNNVFKRLGLIGISLCVACCALPIIGIVLGVSALSSIAAYLEKTALIVFVVSAGFFALAYFFRKNSSCGDSCSVDCACKGKLKV